MFGFCATGHCNSCPGKYQRFYIGKQKVKRKTVETIIWLDEWRECDHRCHGNASVKKTTTKRRRKK